MIKLPVDRHAARSSRLISVSILLALGAFFTVIPFFTPEDQVQSTKGYEQTVSADASSPCVPEDQAVGIAGGDPHGFHVFSRDEQLDRQRTLCASATATIRTNEAERVKPR